MAEGNGSVTILENNSTSRDTRKTFFQVLNQIDRFGDLRTSYIYKLLGVQGNYDVMTGELRKLYDAPGRYYHTWEHITDCLRKLFEVAIAENLTDDEIAIIGGAILFHDIIYTVTDDIYYRANEARSAQFSHQYLESR